MGIGTFFCDQNKKNNNIQRQYIMIELLEGLNPNNKLYELNALLQCLCHIEPLVNYFKYKFEEIKKISSYKKAKDNGLCLTECFKNIIDVGCGELQHLLSHKAPDYYTSGVYGWNADIYKINNNTVIVTGYRPFGNIGNWNLAREYFQKALDACEGDKAAALMVERCDQFILRPPENWDGAIAYNTK